jgi:hypothetical protein
MSIKSIFGAVGMYMSLLSFTAIGVPMYEYNISGDITGVSGLEVNGTVWDMTLHDGTFQDLYDAGGSTAIYAQPFAREASNQLTLFTSGHIDVLERFIGCSQPTSFCYIATAYAYDGALVTMWADLVYPDTATDVLRTVQTNDTFDLSGLTWATWSAAGAVPEPSILVLMSSGLIAFGVVRRKSRA